jgi:hypothetical protein
MDIVRLVLDHLDLELMMHSPAATLIGQHVREFPYQSRLGSAGQFGHFRVEQFLQFSLRHSTIR